MNILIVNSWTWFDYAKFSHIFISLVTLYLSQVGRVLKKGESFGSVESVKAASDVYAPMSGKVNLFSCFL